MITEWKIGDDKNELPLTKIIEFKTSFGSPLFFLSSPFLESVFVGSRVCEFKFLLYFYLFYCLLYFFSEELSNIPPKPLLFLFLNIQKTWSIPLVPLTSKTKHTLISAISFLTLRFFQRLDCSWMEFSPLLLESFPFCGNTKKIWR